MWTRCHGGFWLVLALLVTGGCQSTPAGEQGNSKENAEPERSESSQHVPGADPKEGAPSETDTGTAPANDATAREPVLPAADCGQPVCDTQLVALFPDAVGDWKLIRRQTMSESRAQMGMPASNGPPNAHASYSPSGKLTPDEPVININVQYYPDAAYAPVGQVTSRAVGTVEGAEPFGGNGQKSWFAAGAHRAKRSSWMQGNGIPKSQITVALGAQIGVDFSVDGEHVPEEIEALVAKLPLDGWAGLQP